MLTRFIAFSLLFTSFSALTYTDKTLTIYHDADYSLNQLSAKAMKMGLLTAFDEVDNEIQGFRLVLKEKNHRGNIKRSLLTMKKLQHYCHNDWKILRHRSPVLSHHSCRRTRN